MAVGYSLLFLSEASADFLFHLTHPQIPFSAIAVERYFSMVGEQQDGIFMLVHPIAPAVRVCHWVVPGGLAASEHG